MENYCLFNFFKGLLNINKHQKKGKLEEDLDKRKLN